MPLSPIPASLPVILNKLFPIQVRTVAGLEEVLARELAELGATDIEVHRRVVRCTGDLRLMYRANIRCRTAIRVLRPLASFPAPDEKALYQGIRDIDWTPWLAANGTLSVDAHVYSSFTTHSLFVAQLAKDAIVDRFRDETGQRPSVDLVQPELRIAIGLFENTAEICVDASGESLHKRGYRQRAGEAPMKETLAAGILKLSGWNADQPLLDPMTGSGTLAIEAGLMLKNIAPGLLRRRFGFQLWADYDRPLHDSLIAEAKAAIRNDRSVPIVGLEIDPELAEIARENVERAGLSDIVKIENGDFFKWDRLPTPAGILVMNPPYDERLPLENVAEFYQRIGDRFKQTYGGWTAYVLSGNLDAMKYFGLRSAKRFPLNNGSIECRLIEYQLLAGTSAGPREPRPLPENPQWAQKAEVFANRVAKNHKHLAKWARREGITCWRLYDRDIPEFQFIVDIFEDRLHFAEIERNHDRSPLEHERYLRMMAKRAALLAQIAPENIFIKRRKQPTAAPEPVSLFEVREGGQRFLIDLVDHVDVGLFLEQRKLRAWIQKESAGKDFLNLFGYTGSATVFAAAGGAKTTVTVDASLTHLEWAEQNFALGGLSEKQHRLVHNDVLDFIEGTKDRFDLCFVDPPTRWVNRGAGRQFEVQADHLLLLRRVFDRLRPGGKVLFTTNYRTFVLDEPALRESRKLAIREITASTTPLDFERRPTYRSWWIELSL